MSDTWVPKVGDRVRQILVPEMNGEVIATVNTQDGCWEAVFVNESGFYTFDFRELEPVEPNPARPNRRAARRSDGGPSLVEQTEAADSHSRPNGDLASSHSGGRGVAEVSGLPKGEPILIECEGSGSRTRFLPFISGRKHICPMCGQEVVPDTRGSAPSHKRDDLLARIKRGDFG